MKQKRKWMALVSISMMLLAVMGASAAQNYVRDGGSVTHSNSSTAIVSGQIVDVGYRYGIAMVDIASNATGAVATRGVWRLKRATTNAVTIGTPLYYSTATSVTATATPNTYIGVCYEAVANADAVGETIMVELNVLPRQCIVGVDVAAYE